MTKENYISGIYLNHRFPLPPRDPKATDPDDYLGDPFWQQNKTSFRVLEAGVFNNQLRYDWDHFPNLVEDRFRVVPSGCKAWGLKEGDFFIPRTIRMPQRSITT